MKVGASPYAAATPAGRPAGGAGALRAPHSTHPAYRTLIGATLVAQGLVTTWASWGTRSTLMASEGTTLLSLINYLRELGGKGPLDGHVGQQAVADFFRVMLSSTAASSVLGAANGASNALFKPLLQVLRLDDVPANPRLKLLLDDFTTVVFSAMVMAVRISQGTAADEIPTGMKPGNVTGDAPFGMNAWALTNGVAGGAAVLLALVIAAAQDCGLKTKATPDATLGGALSLVVQRSRSGFTAFTECPCNLPPLMPVLMGLPALVKPFMKHQPAVAHALIDGGIGLMSFLMLAHKWGIAKTCFDMSDEQFAGLRSVAPDSQQARFETLAAERQRRADRRWMAPQGFCEQAVVVCTKAYQAIADMATAAMVTGYLTTFNRDVSGASLDDFRVAGRAYHEESDASIANWVVNMLLVGTFLSVAAEYLARRPLEAPEAVRSRLAAAGRNVGTDRQHSSDLRRMNAIVAGMIGAVLVATGALPVVHGIGFAAGVSMFDVDWAFPREAAQALRGFREWAGLRRDAAAQQRSEVQIEELVDQVPDEVGGPDGEGKIPELLGTPGLVVHGALQDEVQDAGSPERSVTAAAAEDSALRAGPMPPITPRGRVIPEASDVRTGWDGKETPRGLRDRGPEQDPLTPRSRVSQRHEGGVVLPSSHEDPASREVPTLHQPQASIGEMVTIQPRTPRHQEQPRPPVIIEVAEAEGPLKTPRRREEQHKPPVIIEVAEAGDDSITSADL